MTIALYVDDLLIRGSNVCSILWMKKELKERFEMKDPGEARIILGEEIVPGRKKKKLSLPQEKNSKKDLDRFEMEMARPANVSMQGTLRPEKRLEVGTNDFCLRNVFPSISRPATCWKDMSRHIQKKIEICEQR